MTENGGNIVLDIIYSINRRSEQNVKNSIDNLKKKSSSVETAYTKAFGKIGKAVTAAFSVSAIVAFTKKITQLGSDLAEVQNVVDVTFGSSANKINAFASTAIKSIGMSETAAKNYTGTLGAMAKSFDYTQEEAANMSISLTKLTGDVASFYNLDHDAAYNKIKAVFTGETESLKSLGVVMTQTALQEFAYSQGINKTISAMSEKEKVGLRYKFVIDKLKDTEGDFLRNGDSWAVQTRVLSENVKQLLTQLGSATTQLLLPVIQSLNKFISLLSVAVNKLLTFIGVLTGKNLTGGSSSSGGIGAAVEDLADLEDGYESAGDAAKAASTSLTKFDNVAQLSDSAGSSSGVGVGDAFNIDIPEWVDNSELLKTETIFDRIGEKIQKFFDKPLFNTDKIKENVKSIGNSVKNILEGIAPSAEKMMKSFANSIKVKAITVLAVGKSIVEALTGGIAKWLEDGQERITNSWENICNNFTNAFDNISDITENIGSLLTDFFSLDSVKNAIANALTSVEEVITTVIELLSGLFDDLTEFISKTIDDNFEGLQNFVESVGSLFEEFTGLVRTVVGDICKSVLNNYNKYIKPTFKALQEGTSKIVKAVLDAWNGSIAPLLSILIERVQALWTQHIKPFVDKVLSLVGIFVKFAADVYNKVIAPIVGFVMEYMVPYLSVGLSMIFGFVEGLVGDIIDAVGGLIEFVKGIITVLDGILTGDFKQVVEGLKSILKGLFDYVKNTFTSIVNAIIGGLNGLIRGANKIKIPGTDFGVSLSEIPEWKPKLAEGGIVYKPTDFGGFMAGEAGAEAIVPLQNSNYTKQLASEIVKGLSAAGFGGGDTYNIENAFGDDRSMERLVNKIDDIKRKKDARKGAVVYA